MRISCELEGILWTWPENPAWSLFNWTLGVAWVSTVYDVEIGYIFKEIRHNFKNRSLMEKKCMYKYFSCKGYVTVKKIASRWNDTKMRKRKWKTYQCMFFWVIPAQNFGTAWDHVTCWSEKRGPKFLHGAPTGCNNETITLSF